MELLLILACITQLQFDAKEKQFASAERGVSVSSAEWRYKGGASLVKQSM